VTTAPKRSPKFKFTSKDVPNGTPETPPTMITLSAAFALDLVPPKDEPKPTPPPPTPAPSGSATSMTFKAVEGGGETRDGGLLMVEAYALVWLLLMGWLVMLWRKQATLNVRLDGLEKAIDEAALAAETAKK